MNLDDRSLVLLAFQLALISLVGSAVLALRVSPATRVWCIRLTLLALVGFAIVSQLPATQSLPQQRAIMIPPTFNAVNVVNHEIDNHNPWLAKGPDDPNARLEVSAFGIWAAGASFGLLWCLSGVFQIRRLRRRSVTSSSFEGIEVREAASINSPLVAGFFRPALYVPEGLLSSVSTEEGDAILAHELAHIRHRDLLWKAAHRLVCVLLWPALVPWFLMRPHDRAMEELADARASLVTTTPERYADLLLNIAKQRRGRDATFAVTMTPKRSNIGRRIRRILEGNQMKDLKPFSRGARTAVALFGCVCVTAILVGFGWKQEAKDPKKNPWQKPDHNVRFHILHPDATEAKDAEAWLLVTKTDYNVDYQPLQVKEGWVSVDPKMVEALQVRVLARDSEGNIGSAFMTGEDSDVKLVATTSVTGVLVKPDGSPEAGIDVRAELSIISAPTENSPGVTVSLGGSPLASTATTDDDGRFTLAGIPQSSITQISISDLSYQQPMNAVKTGASTTYGFKVNQSATDWGRITLRVAGRVSGRVMLNGKGVAGIRIGAQIINDDMVVGLPESAWADAVTDADGNYEIGRLGNAKYNIALMLPDELSKDYAAAALDSLDIRRGVAIRNQNFELRPGGVIEGKVILKDNADPAGYPVGYYGPDHPQSGAWCGLAKCDSKGHFRFHVSPGKQYVYCQTKGTGGQAVTVEDGQTVHITLKE